MRIRFIAVLAVLVGCHGCQSDSTAPKKMSAVDALCETRPELCGVSGSIDFMRVNDTTLQAICKPAAGDPPCGPWWTASGVIVAVHAIDSVEVIGGVKWPIGKTAVMQRIASGPDTVCVLWDLRHVRPQRCYLIK